MTDIIVILAASEPSVPIALRQALEKEGFCVKLCDTGLRALDELAAHGADCLISATQLEDLNGYQLSSLIKSNDRTHRLPIILLASEATKQRKYFLVSGFACRYDLSARPNRRKS